MFGSCVYSSWNLFVLYFVLTVLDLETLLLKIQVGKHATLCMQSIQYSLVLVLVYRLHTHRYYSRLIIYSKKVTCRITNTMSTVIFSCSMARKHGFGVIILYVKFLKACLPINSPDSIKI